MNIPFKAIGQGLTTFSMLAMAAMTFLSSHPGSIPGAADPTCSLRWTVNVDNNTATLLGHGTLPGLYNLYSCGSTANVHATDSPVRYCKRIDNQGPSEVQAFLGGMTIWSCKVG